MGNYVKSIFTGPFCQVALTYYYRHAIHIFVSFGTIVIYNSIPSLV